jgi:hypothetical protein
MAEVETCSSITPKLHRTSSRGLGVDNVKSVITCTKSANIPLGSRGENSLTLPLPNVLDRAVMKMFLPVPKILKLA